MVDRPEQAAWVAAASGPAATVVVFPDLSPAGVAGAPGRLLADRPAVDRAAASLDRSGPDDPAMIVFTSGTTGAPKGAVLSHANLLAGVRGGGACAWRWEPDDRLVLALPLFHVHGLCAGLFGTLAAGASAVVLDAVLGATACSTRPSGHGGTLFFGVPTMYHRLAESARVAELARLRLCVSGSAPLPAPLWDRVRAAPGVAILERYGMTETLLTVSNPYDGERRPGTVGFPLPGVEVAHGRGRRRSCSSGGRRSSAATGSGRRLPPRRSTDGWFRTGDVARVDADGYLAIRGRRRDLIISGGYNVYPAEVEDVLLGSPGGGRGGRRRDSRRRSGARRSSAWVVPAAGPVPVDTLAGSPPTGWRRTSGRVRCTWSTRCPATPWARCNGRAPPALRCRPSFAGPGGPGDR